MSSKRLSIWFSALLTTLCFSSILISNNIYANTTKTAVQADKIVTVYLLIDSKDVLQKYVNDLNKIDKPNFNRVIFSFVKPNLSKYTSGSLANTGILDYYGEGDGRGDEAFNQLKAAAALSKQKNIQAFLSVGGWNYSCNFDIYGTSCGAAPTAENGIKYDWFPDPTDPNQADTAKTSYANLIKLTNDLGMDGIDFDYEEMWHADYYAESWTPSSSGEWSTAIANNILAAGGPTYDNVMKYGTGQGVAFVMPKTINKMAAILHELIDNPNASTLLFSSAAPPVGARPTTGFVYGDSYPDINTKGGVWWKGNLKGIWYHLADKDQAIVERFDSLGLMTYDICGDNAQLCAPYSGAGIDLASQVDAYMKDYTNWLKSDAPTATQLSIDANGKVTFLPAKFKLATKIQFGVEVNQPAYPQNPSGQLQLTNTLVDTITDQQKNSDGVIIWQMYSKQNMNVADATTVKYTLQKSCQTFLGNDTRYDCNAQFPN